MREGRGTRQAARPTARRDRLGSCLVLGALCLVLLASCRTTSPEPKQAPVDPLLGGPPVQKGTPPSAAPRADATPGLPAPSSSTSPAALANGAVPSLDPNRELSINDRNTGTAATPTGGWRGPGSTAAGGAPDVQLRPPVPAGAPTAPPRQDAPPLPAATPRVATFEQAEDALRARGVTWQRLETAPDTGEWKFSCFIPSRDNPSVHRTYEARARDQVAALQAVLEQIDREQRQ